MTKAKKTSNSVSKINYKKSFFFSIKILSLKLNLYLRLFAEGSREFKFISGRFKIFLKASVVGKDHLSVIEWPQVIGGL